MDQASLLTYNDLLLENKRLKDEIHRKNVELIHSQQIETNKPNTATTSSSLGICTPLETSSDGETIVLTKSEYDSLVHQKGTLIQVVLRLKDERDELKKACKVLATSRSTMIKVIDDLSTKVKLLHRALQETHSHAAVASKSVSCYFPFTRKACTTCVLFCLANLLCFILSCLFFLPIFLQPTVFSTIYAYFVSPYAFNLLTLGNKANARLFLS